MFRSIVCIAACISSASAFSNVNTRMSARQTAISMADIVDTAVGAGSFKTLVAAVTAAGLVPTLKSAGPFTVFAPSDEAFAKLPPGTVESLLKDIPALTKILTYHVVSGNVPASTVVTLNGQKVATVNGEKVDVVVDASGVKVNSANVVTTDIVCDNGVIHVIDSVLLPPAPKVVFKPDTYPGVSAPFGFFDPLGLAYDIDERSFKKYRESEVKHGRIAMLAVLGVIVGESGFNLFGDEITGPAIYQFQQAEQIFPAFAANVIGLTLAVEGFNIINGWESPDDTFSSELGVAALKSTYQNGDLKFDPLGLKPRNAAELKTVQTKELNNGRLAMLAIAGIVAQELVTGAPIF